MRRVAGQYRRGSVARSKRDYLHLLYIARGSLSETQYFVHLARRLGYLSLEEAEALGQRMKVAFGCLRGLIRAVEKEAGKLGQVIATVTSLLVIGLMRWSGGQVVGGLVVSRLHFLAVGPQRHLSIAQS